MKTIDLKVQTRNELGKKAAKAVRKSGGIPAILYGRGISPTPLAVSQKDLHRATHTKAGGNVLISLKVEGEKAKKDTTCLIKEAQRDPVTDEIQHVDFVAISLTEKIRVRVPLTVKDAEQAPGVKEGGVLDVVHHEIEVECLPTEIPERLEVSVKPMKIGDVVHLKEIQFPPNVNAVLEAEEVVIALHPPQKEEEAAPLAEGAVEPEVIEKGKKEKPEEGAEAAASEKAEKTEKKPEKASEKPEKKPA